MMAAERILIIGFDPHLIDYTDEAYAAFPGMTAEKVMTGIAKNTRHLESLGYDIAVCLIDAGHTAEETVKDCLRRDRFDCVVIGSGLRLMTGNTVLFENVVNVVHQFAPQTKLAFNTSVSDSAETIQRQFTKLAEAPGASN
jgi:hypothetical protein